MVDIRWSQLKRFFVDIILGEQSLDFFLFCRDAKLPTSWGLSATLSAQGTCLISPIQCFNVAHDQRQRCLKGQHHEIIDPRFFFRQITPLWSLVNVLKYF
jgi:hypothetical protein